MNRLKASLVRLVDQIEEEFASMENHGGRLETQDSRARVDSSIQVMVLPFK